jgi:hypothetical protein
LRETGGCKDKNDGTYADRDGRRFERMAIGNETEDEPLSASQHRTGRIPVFLSALWKAHESKKKIEINCETW